MKKVMFVVLIVMLLLAMAIPAFAAPAEKVPVCHLTSSDTNEWVVINVSENAWQSHSDHGDEKVGVTVDENCEPLISTCTVTDANAYTATYEVPEDGFIWDTRYGFIRPDGSTDSATLLVSRGEWKQQVSLGGLNRVASPIITTTCALPSA